ncbi:MAG TPA: SpoIID/LytB domain-containing protein, partial [Blastocatellia bacterium]|nr:SpoIID/LytB domain-containing protein [Blastocatellia bacterium]
VNGGHLYRPQQTKDAAFVPAENARLSVSPAHRKALIEGMRGAVKYGTAGKTDLGKLPGYVLGKTGTSTASNGFRTQGWFVGFAAATPATGVPQPEQIKLGVLVFLKRAHGAQAAETVKPIFDAVMSGQSNRISTASSSERLTSFQTHVGTDSLATARGTDSAAYPQSVRVRSVSENVTRELPLEDYVAGVLVGEASIEREVEALKAQAVVSRTFALKNLGRHAREGFDFCSTTHCQRFVLPNERLHAAARRAATATRGEVLRDQSGGIAEVYFHAACGGVTANIESLWGVDAPEYLRGVRDEFCATMPHRRWEQTIPAARLAEALQRDERTNAGATVKSLTVSKRDATGRAEWLTIEGARQVKVRGWDFKLIVGRGLGWQMIKSSRFDVARVGDDFVFRGGGFGHGLGLCQEGARGAARRGMNYRQIVGFYFPGTRLARELAQAGERRYWLQTVSTATMQTDSSRNIVSSEHFRVRYGAGNDRREVEGALRTLEAARADLLRRLETASLRLNEAAPFEVVIHATTAEFIAATGLSGWAMSATRGRRMELQPLTLLRKRGVAATALRHELAHSFIELLGAGQTPRWLAEGLCLHVAGEGRVMMQVKISKPLPREVLAQKLSKTVSAAESKVLYAMAYREVQALIQSKGEAFVWRLAARAN